MDEELKEKLANEIAYWENERANNRNKKAELLRDLAVNEAKQSLIDDVATTFKQLRGDI